MRGGPLDGLRVLECAHYIAGPRCAQILADHGADVVKLEPPYGDLARRSPPVHDGWSMYFAAHNRRKRSIAVDLKRPEAAPVLERLLRWAEVVVTNYTPSVTERLGIDLRSAARVNPRIVVVRISAYGLTGSRRDDPGFDGPIQARSGLAHMIGPADRPPTATSVPLTDYFAAVEGALATLLALRRRDETGEGQEVDVSMMDVTSTMLGYLFAEVLSFGEHPVRSGSRAPYALTGVHPTADGFVYIAPLGPAWRSLCELIGRPEWGAPDSPYADAQGRLRDRDAIEAAIGEWTRARPRDAVIAALGRAGIACGPVHSVDEAARDPLLAEREMLQEVRLGDGGRAVAMPAVEIKVAGVGRPAREPVVPRVGACTDEVLREIGFTAGEAAGLAAAGVVGASEGAR